MNVTRRGILATSASTLALGLGHARLVAQAAAPPVTSFTDLRRGVGMFMGQRRHHRLPRESTPAPWPSTASSPTPPRSPWPGLKQRAPKGIEMLLNTHHHGDHTGGNQVFRGAVKRIVGHENCLAWHRTAAAAAKSESQTSFADTTFTDSWKTKFGDETIQARYYGPGHTSGDAVYHLEKANVVHMGDLLFNRAHPNIDRAAGRLDRQLDHRAREGRPRPIRTTPSSSPAMPRTTPSAARKADVMRFRDYLIAVHGHRPEGVEAGQSKEETAEDDGAAGLRGQRVAQRAPDARRSCWACATTS